MRSPVASRLLLLATTVLCACGGEPPPNVLLVSIDTLRADAVGAYGGPVPTPALDGLAGSGVLFEQAVAPAPETASSHATLFTGQEVQRHGVVRNGVALPDELETLAEVFRAAGYATGAVVSSFVLDPRFGWIQGFEAYDAEFPKERETFRHRTDFWAQFDFEGFDRPAIDTNERAIPWLEAASEPFFLFVHYFDPHAPNVRRLRHAERVPEPFVKGAASRRVAPMKRQVPQLGVEELERVIRNYHAEVLYTDRALGALLDALDVKGCRERTLVVVTADHGEGLGQHGSLDHAPFVYEEQVRIPLVLSGPRGLPRGVRLGAQVGLVDVAPTVAELAGIDFPSETDGRSLAAAIRAAREPESRPILGRRRRYARPMGPHRGTKFFVRTERWKYIRASEDPDELYDLTEDSRELRNVHGARADVVERLGALLDAHLAAHPVRDDEIPGLSEEARRGLEALGYAD